MSIWKIFITFLVLHAKCTFHWKLFIRKAIKSKDISVNRYFSYAQGHGCAQLLPTSSKNRKMLLLLLFKHKYFKLPDIAFLGCPFWFEDLFFFVIFWINILNILMLCKLLYILMGFRLMWTYLKTIFQLSTWTF